MAANPLGDLLAVGSCGHAIQLWNINSRTLERRIALPQECAETLSFSPDGAYLATGAYGCCRGSDKGLQVWDTRTGNLARTFAGASGIRRVVFSGDGRWLAGVDQQGKATVFEWPTGRQLRTYEGLDEPGFSRTALIASRDGRYLAWLGTGLRVWDMASGNEIELPGKRQIEIDDRPPGRPEQRRSEEIVSAEIAEFLEDGRLAYVDRDKMILRQLPDGPQKVISLPQPETQFSGDIGITKEHSWLKIRRDGLLLAGSRESQTIVYDVAAGRLRELIAPALITPSSLQWSRSGHVLWADLSSGVRGWDDREGKPVNFGPGLDGGTSLAIRPDGTRVAAGGLSSVYILDVAKRRVVVSRKLEPSPGTAIAFSPDGLRVAFAASQNFGIFAENLQPQTQVATLDEFAEVERVAFSPDGRWIAAGIGGAHPAVRVWPVLGQGTAVTLASEKLTYGPQPPAFTADSRWLASFTQGSTVNIWSTAVWNIEQTWMLVGTGRALAFAPTGSRLAVASDGEAAIWDANTGQKLVTFLAPGSAQFEQIAWSPDGQSVVSSADDGVIRFWSSSDGRLLASLYMLESRGDWLLVTPDGRLDGSDRAVTEMVGWRVLNTVVSDRALTRAHRVPDLWSLIFRRSYR
jgi:WD40 repeat protein